MMCDPQPFHNCQEKCVARRTQIHGNHGSGVLLNPCVLCCLVQLWWTEHFSSSLCGALERSACPLWLRVSRHVEALLTFEPLALACDPRTLQQQVSALSAQNGALEMELRSQQNIAQGLAELLGAITTMLNSAPAPTRRMLVDSKGLESHQSSLAKKKTSTCGPRKLKTTCRVCFLTCVELCRSQWSHKT